MKKKTEGHKQAATEGGCSKCLAKHLKGGNSAFGDVHGFHTQSLTAKNFHPSIKNNSYIYD